MADPFLLHDNGKLLCPLCGGSYIHLNEAVVAGRPREDGPVIHASINANGEASTDGDVNGAFEEPGRRHTFRLAGYCEQCGGRFAFQFQQHKGETLVSVLRDVWSPVSQIANPDTN